MGAQAAFARPVSLQEKFTCPCWPGGFPREIPAGGAGLVPARGCSVSRLCPGCSTKPHGSAPWKWIWIHEVWCCGCERMGWVLLGRDGCTRKGLSVPGKKGMSASGKGGVLGEGRMGVLMKEWVLWGRDGWSREGVGAPGKGKVLLGRRAGSRELARAVPVQPPLIRLCKWPRSRGERSKHRK